VSQQPPHSSQPPDVPDWSTQPPDFSVMPDQPTQPLEWDDQSPGWAPPPGQSLRLPDWPAELPPTGWLPQPYQPQREWTTGDLLLPPQQPGSNRKTLVAIVGSGVVVLLVLGLCGGLFISGLGGLLGNGLSGASGGGNTATATSSATNSSATATDTGSASPTPIPTASAGATPFSVSGVTASASPGNFSGACATTMTFTISASITAPAGTPGGNVTFDWQRSDGTTGTQETITFAPGQTAQIVKDSWQLSDEQGTGATFWEKAQVTAPNSVTSPAATFTFTCRAAAVSAHAVVSPTSYNCSNLSPQVFTFTATLQVGAMSTPYTIQYYWFRSNGTKISGAIMVPKDTASVQILNTWTLYPTAKNQSFSEEIVTTAPNGVTSNEATFTKNC